jgi:outer membrane protein, multidrug efflux system
MHLHNIKKFNKLVLCLLVLFFALNSCKILQPYKHPDVVSDKTLFRDLPVNDSTTVASIPWKNFFSDKNLQSLIEEALKSNPDLQVAVARVKKADAALKQSRAAFFPTLSANGTYQNMGGSKGSTVLKEFELYGSTSWEADIWGKLRGTKRASMASFLESDAYKRAVQTQLISNVAISYYTLLAYDAKLQVTEKTLENRTSDVEVMKVMKDNDMVTGADLVQSQANLYSAKVTIPDIKQSIYETENALCLLLGRNPGPITRSSLSEQEISVNLTTGLPAQLIANRPDIQEAEYQYRYGFEMTNVARKYFYPSITLTATGGIYAYDLPKLFDASSTFWNLIAGLTQPIFNQGLNRQRLKTAEANQEEYLATYKKTLLTAAQEVVNAMHGYQTATEKIALRTSQIGYLEKSVDYTMELLKYTSSTNYTDVLTSEVNLLSAQLNSINDKMQQLESIVSLYQSLGGGWKE